MQQPSKSNPGVAAASSAATELFRRAAAEARDTLNGAELKSLLSGMGLALDEAAARPAQASAVDLRIGLEDTREFGPVISAGSGGVDAELGESHFRRDRACVHAAVALTDADDFLDLFRRTLAYRKLARLARRDARPLARRAAASSLRAGARAGESPCGERSRRAVCGCAASRSIR